jgi:hypothetical protein
MLLTWFSIALLGVWRVTHLLVAEDGPWDVVARLREAAGPGFWGKLLDCFACLSLWISAPFALIVGTTWLECAIMWPALSGGSMLIELVVAKYTEPPPAPYIEDSSPTEGDDVMLRK